MSKKSSTSSVTEFLTGLLTIAFIVLKITKYIDWSWWWVLSPLWITILAGLGFILIGYLYAYIRYKLKLKKFKKILKETTTKQYDRTSTPDLSFDSSKVLDNLSGMSHKFMPIEVTIKVNENIKENSNEPSKN